ncbi:hypothetical protein OQJ26_14520 [Legionella sp. PATHC038]|uniref:hypothetical protein n=1 Tax=Legionella sheltonii TaxID=2992041 RepID=UPI0022432B47|nr:hypothetical protein [Legionella sp. PATHC038]MCW8399995.1 hypothetical protein [Legionella sp. PATHC038]
MNLFSNYYSNFYGVIPNIYHKSPILELFTSYLPIFFLKLLLLVILRAIKNPRIIMSIFNPLKNLIETKQYPHARAYRTTFWGKMADTFLVFSGHLLPNYKNKEQDPFKKIHLGIFDYLTAGIHLLISSLLIRSLKGAEKPVLIPVGIFTFLFNLPRLLFAAAMTLICSPFVAIAWAATKEKGNKIKDDILSYEVQTNQSRLYFAPSALPSDLEHYKDCFFFIEGSNCLYYINFSSKPHELKINDIEGFRQEMGVNRHRTAIRIGIGYYSLFVNRDDLKKYFAEEKSPLDSYRSLGDLLKARNVDLEEIEKSSIEREQDVIKISLTDEEKRPLAKFSLSIKKSTDLLLFHNLRRLNIGGIEEIVEEKEEFSQFVSP